MPWKVHSEVLARLLTFLVLSGSRLWEEVWVIPWKCSGPQRGAAPALLAGSSAELCLYLLSRPWIRRGCSMPKTQNGVKSLEDSAQWTHAPRSMQCHRSRTTTGLLQQALFKPIFYAQWVILKIEFKLILSLLPTVRSCLLFLLRSFQAAPSPSCPLLASHSLSSKVLHQPFCFRNCVYCSSLPVADTLPFLPGDVLASSLPALGYRFLG